MSGCFFFRLHIFEVLLREGAFPIHAPFLAPPPLCGCLQRLCWLHKQWPAVELKARYPFVESADGVGETGWWNRPYESVPETNRRAHRVVELFKVQLQCQSVPWSDVLFLDQPPAKKIPQQILVKLFLGIFF